MIQAWLGSGYAHQPSARGPDDPPIHRQRAAERLRQEREVFDQRKRQDSAWFRLRIGIGFAAALLIPAIACASFYVVLTPGYSSRLKEMFSAALLGDVLGLTAAVWKIVLPSGAVSTRLDPVTDLPQAIEDENNGGARAHAH